MQSLLCDNKVVYLLKFFWNSEECKYLFIWILIGSVDVKFSFFISFSISGSSPSLFSYLIRFLFVWQVFQHNVPLCKCSLLCQPFRFLSPFPFFSFRKDPFPLEFLFLHPKVIFFFLILQKVNLVLSQSKLHFIFYPTLLTLDKLDFFIFKVFSLKTVCLWVNPKLIDTLYPELQSCYFLIQCQDREVEILERVYWGLA